jgi:two-component system, OmpR family, sensor kinase
VHSQLVDLHILIKNLIENALRYTPDGGQVEIQLQRSEQTAQLIVKDTGPGIPAAEQGRVFDAFYRVLGTGQQGSGLGLSIVKTIAARLGLRVSLENNPAPATGLSVCVTFTRPAD